MRWKYLNRPRVFISSTIYDFKDLRSALKYWLEEMGFEAVLQKATILMLFLTQAHIMHA